MNQRLKMLLIGVLLFAAGYVTAFLQGNFNRPWFSFGCSAPGETHQDNGEKVPWPSRPIRPGF